MWLGHNAEPHSASDMKGPFPFKCFKETQRDGARRPWRTVFSLGISRNNNGRKKNPKNIAGKCSQPPEKKKLLMSHAVTSELPVPVQHNVSSVENLDGTACDFFQSIHHGVTYAVAPACTAHGGVNQKQSNPGASEVIGPGRGNYGRSRRWRAASEDRLYKHAGRGLSARAA